MTSAITPFDPLNAIDDVKKLANLVLSLRDGVFREGLDFGKIPGTGDKPTLLLPGMEKLMRALHLRAEYVEKSRIEDFDANLIYYRYECRLIDYETGLCVSTAIGSANSRESKWRWRDQKRTCPKCGKETINRSKFPPKGAPQGTEPGWYCYAKAGGCGAEYAASDAQITGQTVGRVENPDIFDQMNTIDKIAQKRALGSAIKGAANVSEFFTVDLEDFQAYETRPLPENVVEGSFSVVEESKSESQPSAGVRGAGIPQPAVQHSQPYNATDIMQPVSYWSADESKLTAFYKSALERFSFAHATVDEVLTRFEGLQLADWRAERGWALAALVAEYCENNLERIDNWTASMGGDEQAALKLCERARQIANLVQAQPTAAGAV